MAGAGLLEVQYKAGHAFFNRCRRRSSFQRYLRSTAAEKMNRIRVAGCTRRASVMSAMKETALGVAPVPRVTPCK
jgi:hypothetical protein